MSRFYGTIQAERGEASRAGHRNISGHIRGWKSGVEVFGTDEDERDVFLVFATGGSDGGQTPRLIARVKLDDDGKVVVEHVDIEVAA